MMKASELRNGKVPVCIRNDYVFFLEFFEGLLWFHANVSKWSAQVKKSYRRDFDLLEELVGKPIFVLIRNDDTKLARFAKATGWFEKCQISLLDGTKAFIYTNKV